MISKKQLKKLERAVEEIELIQQELEIEYYNRRSHRKIPKTPGQKNTRNERTTAGKLWQTNIQVIECLFCREQNNQTYQ